MNNFLSSSIQRSGTWWQKQSSLKKTMVIFLFCVVLIVLCIAAWSARAVQSGVVVYQESMAAKEKFEEAQNALKEEDFNLAFTKIIEASDHFEKANKKFDNIEAIQLFPQLKSDVVVANDILQAAESLSAGLSVLATIAQEVSAITDSDAAFDEITPEQKERILQVLYEAPPALQGAKANLELALYIIENLPQEDVHPELQKVIDTIKQEAPALETVIHSAIPVAEVLPTLLGYPEEKVYMLLLQNNNELRATGGFIGTIGFVKVNKGEIVDIYTDNVYNIDELLKKVEDVGAAPEPITFHTGTKENFLRNINWEPNFPTSALAAKEKYLQAGATETQIDGVIAFDLNFIEDIMRITGPIEADGDLYTAENLFELLEHNVEFGYAEKGISDADRKEIINVLSENLQTKLLNLPRTKFSDVWKAFEENSDQKHVQLFITDESVQRLFIEQNWAGEMKLYSGDYFAVIDSNLAALKTDEKMERDIAYSVTEENGVYYGTLEMNYFNTTEQITPFYTRYRTHTRFYLPLGSQIVEQSGFVTNDRLKNGVPTEGVSSEIAYELGDGDTVSYTVMEGFVAVEPQAREQVRLKYILPDSVVEDIQNGTYTLHAQKQAGTEAHGLQVRFDIGKPIESVTPVDKSTKTGNNAYSIDWDLETDRDIIIKMKP